MRKKRYSKGVFNQKIISFGIGGALIGYFLFQSIEATIIGGIGGILLSFVKWI